MKICFIAPSIEVPGRDGGSTHVFEVARGFAGRGNSVILLARNKRKISIKNLDVLDVSGPSFVRYAKVFLKGLHAASSCDVIYERTDFVGVGALLSVLFHKPLVMETNSAIIDERAPRFLKGLLNWWLNARYGIAKKIVATVPTVVPASFREKVFLTEWGFNDSSFSPIDMLEARKAIGLPNGKKIILFTGASGPWHGLQDLLNAVPLVRKKFSDVLFLLVGKIDKPDIIDSAAKLGSSVMILPAVKYDRMNLFLNSADVLVAPFNPEKFPSLKKYGFYWSPLKIFEYMAVGKPIVSTTAVERIVEDKKHGLLAKHGGAESLANAMLFMLENPKKGVKMGENARKKALKEYTWEKHVEKLLKMLERIV
ncbi:glycosyltransferase family 4 protein [Candidatus Micrarchaeota archaeon]|nr:glycosyltransferase family 4 protein [Candidatus Micrarchaeota archaeon]